MIELKTYSFLEEDESDKTTIALEDAEGQLRMEGPLSHEDGGDRVFFIARNERLFCLLKDNDEATKRWEKALQESQIILLWFTGPSAQHLQKLMVSSKR